MKQAEYGNMGADAGFWVDPEAIDPKSWLHVQLHQPIARGEAGLVRRGFSGAQLSGWSSGLAAAEPAVAQHEHAPEAMEPVEEDLSYQRVIPADCVRRLPIERARVTRLPARIVGVARPRRRLFLLAASTYEQRRGRAAAWGLLVVWLIGTWGTFYGLTGGLKSHEKSKAIVSTSTWSW